MRISDWSSDVCSSDLINSQCGEILLFGFGHGPGSCLDRGTFSVKSNDVQGNPVQSWSWDLLKLEALHNNAPIPDAVIEKMASGTPRIALLRVEFEIGRASCRERVCKYV